MHLRYCNIISPARFLPLPEEDEPNNSEVITSHFVTPSPDLQDGPLTNSDLILFVDGDRIRT